MSDLPENWVLTRFGEIAKIRNGYAFKSSDFLNQGVPLIRQSNLSGNKVYLEKCVYLPIEYLEKYKNFQIKKGDLLIGMSGSIGKLCRFDSDVVALQNQRTGLIQNEAEEFSCKSYFWHYLKTLEKQLLDKAKGVAVANVSASDIEALPFPCPPIEEQRRIADKLDTTLARVDTLNDRLARITPLLKRFRQSVLAAATSGRLTEDWRQNKDISTFSWKAITEFREQILPDLPNSWKWVEFSEVASVQSDLRDPSEYQNEIHLAPNHIEPWSGKISGCQTIADDAVKSPKHWFNAGQIVYSKIRPNLCKVAIPNFSGLCSADMYPISTKLNDSYLLLWMLGERFTIWASNAESRTVLPKINTKELGKIPVPVTSAEEQTEIVRRVETLFAFADRLEARLQSAQTAAERLTPALLAKAFRGELVPQDPSDEPAAELLRRLREARAADTASKPKRGRAAKASTVSE